VDEIARGKASTHVPRIETMEDLKVVGASGSLRAVRSGETSREAAEEPNREFKISTNFRGRKMCLKKWRQRKVLTIRTQSISALLNHHHQSFTNSQP